MADHKALRQKLKEAQEVHRRRTKMIPYPLPDLRGPGGNAFVLLAEANRLMKKAGIPEGIQATFHSEATSGEYDQVLLTIEKWFDVSVQDASYTSIQGRTILSFKPGAGDSEESWDEYDRHNPQAPAELDEALESYEATAENDRKVAELQDRINREVRAELGLEDDDVVIVQVKKAKKKEA